MNKVEFISRHEATDRSAGAPRALRSAPKAAKVLLPVWGYHHVRYFLEWSLPTLLAAGNLPAIAAVLPTECVIMTSADDEEFVRQHPAFKALAASCKVAIQHIDHLITDGNYSTTITLTYANRSAKSATLWLTHVFSFWCRTTSWPTTHWATQ